MENMKKCAKDIKQMLNLKTEPVAVFLLSSMTDETTFSNFKDIEKHRYCQALMRARRREAVKLTNEQISCPAAAMAVGFRPLPEGLASGKGLVGFGITQQPETGKIMFENMPHLESGSITHVALCPLKDAPLLPDVVVVEGKPEQLMWLLLADLNMAGGERRIGNTAVLQATWVDSTIIPYLENRMNFTLGCYGCREATDIKTTENVIGFPGKMLESLCRAIEYFSKKAIPMSRSKNAYKSLTEKWESKSCG